MVNECIYMYIITKKQANKKREGKAEIFSMITNGEIRMRVYDGDGKGDFKWVFAGNAHAAFSEGVLRDRASMELGNFDYITQATRRNRIEEKKSERRNSLCDI